MILVLTTEAGDFSHPAFIDWLSYYHADYEILTGESIYKGKSKILIDETGQLFNNGRNYTKDVNVVFNRRWLTSSELPAISKDTILENGLKNTLSAELYELRDYLKYNLENATWIPGIQNLKVNKITILYTARKLGVRIPECIITNSKEELITFHKKHRAIITKAIGNFPRNYTDDNFLVNPVYTKIVSEELIKRLPERFFLSIFQEYIPKKVEYRVLYFNRKCYSVGILSQENEYSMIDSRQKDGDDKEVRLIKTTLPAAFEHKIIDLMEEIDLNIGCIDILQSKDNQLYFLEVNPVGQISGYSLRGNLNFEKEVVEQMIAIDNETERRKKEITNK